MGRVSLLHYFYFCFSNTIKYHFCFELNAKFIELKLKKQLILIHMYKKVTSTLEWMIDDFCQNNKQCRLKKCEFFF